MDKNIYRSQSMQLALQLIGEIRNGTYRAGEKMASIRQLAEKYQVGRQVALSAVTFLCKRNYLYTLHGSGTYVNPHHTRGLFYRLGWFSNEVNLGSGGAYWYALALHLLQKKDFNLILGGNFEEDFTFDQWLKRKGNLDGVFLQGMVNEKMLASLKKHKLPYVVMGNYDISPEHPQVLFNINSVYERSLPELFRKKQWKELAILAADGSLRADRETVEVIRKIADAHNVDCSGELLMRTGGDGYAEIRQLLKKRTPDALLIIGEHWVGMQKFRDRHPEMKLPEIIVPGHIPLIGAANSRYDHVLEFPFEETLRFIDEGIEKMMMQLNFYQNKK